ncbi:MAG: ABC transporter substrate-binding protein [Actinomycetota bacterium]
MTSRRTLRLLAVPLALGLLVAACGSDDDDGGEATTPTTAADSEPDTTEAETESTEAETETTEAETDDGGGQEAEGDVDTEIEADVESVRSFGGDIVFGVEAEATGLRPWEDACGEPCLVLHRAVFDQLAEQAADGTYQPWLAESIEPNEDFTVWTVTLRPDVTFTDGTPVTAQTIADMFPIQQAGAVTSGLISGAGLEAVEATGDLEVTYTLSSSNSAFPAVLANATGRVFEPSAAAADPDGFSTNPIGTGPFAVGSRDLDNETVLVRNENYWLTDSDGNQLPYLDSVSVRPIPDEGTRLDAQLSGTIDVMQTLRQGTIRDARDAGGDFTLLEFQGNNTGGGMYNTSVAPYDDVRVRRGLTLMNNQDAVIEALGGTGISLPTNQWFSVDSPWYSETVAEAWPAFDFDAGVASITEYINDPARSDGKAVGEPIDVELSCPPDPTLIAAMQVIEQVWSGSGVVNVNLTQFDQATHINNALTDVHQAHCWRWSADQDPSISINPFVAPPEASPVNFPNFFSQEWFDAAQAAIQTDDFDERKALYETIMLGIAEEFPIWYSGGTATLLMTDPEIKGINGWLLPSGDVGVGFPGAAPRLQETWIEQ